MIEVRERKTHPRDGYVVAVYVGVRGRIDEQQILVEIYEQYNMWGDESSKGYHYHVYDLSGGKSMEVKTIGGISAPDPRTQEPPEFVRDQYKDYWWRRLR